MKRRFRTPDRVRAILVEHFELFLTTAGVFLAVLLIFTSLPKGEQGLAHAFIIWLQGFLIWSVHRHAWFRRKELVEKMRLMLQDRVNNQLTVMLGMTEFRSRDPASGEKLDMESVTMAARQVAQELDGLSLESLRSWEHRYRYSLRGTRR
ncbi:MAG: hypothetical protein H0X69_15500 [Gemmatimonadales bacterium]|nr:hypothetical protein [Gemmatimonadales bacterium]